MGSGTLAINLITAVAYKDKIRRAFIESISHLEVAHQLGEFFSRTPKAEIGQVLALLCDVLNIIGTREHRKMFPPLHSWMRFFTSRTEANGRYKFF